MSRLNRCPCWERSNEDTDACAEAEVDRFLRKGICEVNLDVC